MAERGWPPAAALQRATGADRPEAAFRLAVGLTTAYKVQRPLTFVNRKLN